jgi:hypothetical protein
LIALTTCVLAVTVGRARRTLVEAVIAARRSANLSRYFASGLVPLLADAEVKVLKRGRRQPAAILFADIRGFTAMSEQLEPAAIAEFLASFRSRATRAIERHGGIVDKFLRGRKEPVRQCGRDREGWSPRRTDIAGAPRFCVRLRLGSGVRSFWGPVVPGSAGRTCACRICDRPGAGASSMKQIQRQPFSLPPG